MPKFGYRYGMGWQPGEGYGYGYSWGPVPGPPQPGPVAPPEPPTFALVVEPHGDTRAEIDVRLPIGFRGVIGRGPSAAVALSAPEASREHAELTVDTDGPWLIDLSSSNGTYVNGVLIGDWTRLHAGDVVTFGPIRASVEIASQHPPTGGTGRSAAVVASCLIILLGLLVLYAGVSG